MLHPGASPGILDAHPGHPGETLPGVLSWTSRTLGRGLRATAPSHGLYFLRHYKDKKGKRMSVAGRAYDRRFQVAGSLHPGVPTRFSRNRKP